MHGAFNALLVSVINALLVSVTAESARSLQSPPGPSNLVTAESAWALPLLSLPAGRHITDSGSERIKQLVTVLVMAWSGQDVHNLVFSARRLSHLKIAGTDQAEVYKSPSWTVHQR